MGHDLLEQNEARVHASYSKLNVAFKKTEAAFLDAKKKYETHQAELNAEAYTLETLKNNAREATERMQEKAAEVDALRQTLAVDEREREVRLTELKGSKRSGFLWK
jgi:DNA repair ATPase RecN